MSPAGSIVRALGAALLLGCLLQDASPAQVRSAGAPRIMLDCWFNNEWKQDAAGHPVRFHYVWSDTANSGFSMLGSILTDSGAVIDTLSTAPDEKSLARGSVYIIVDPDTPGETREPHVIEPADATVIERWVRDGGVLLLMGNDRGNAEFEHLNALAGRFGIQFNEDSRNRVTGSDYAKGTFDRLPPHPLFAGVRKIFLKELSTLRLTGSAVAVLSEGGDVIMATARYGRGIVFAVGDPWFYNEYMDTRRLPEGYDNRKAAGNLFRWLLRQAGTPAQDSLKRDSGGLPFSMPRVPEPVIPPRTVSLSAYGAAGDGLTMNTGAFARAIEECARAGGGCVSVPPGIWLTGPIRLMSRIRLHVERGAVILFSGRFEDYPLLPTGGGYRCVPCLYGEGLEDVAITGDGMFDGQGEYWRPVKREKQTPDQWKALLSSGGAVSADGGTWYPSREAMEGELLLRSLREKGEKSAAEYARAREFLRPVMVRFVDCRRVLIDGPAFVNSPSFHVQPAQCESVIVRNISVSCPWWAQNGDGIDVSSCRNVIISGCTVDAGDDAICLKPGPLSPRQSPGPACENVLVEDCVVYHGHGGFVIGSETWGGARNIAVRRCVFHGTDVGLRFKSAKGKGGRIENVFIQNVRMTSIATDAILFDLLYSSGPGTASGGGPPPGETERLPEFRGVEIRDIDCAGARAAVRVLGLRSRPVGGITLERLRISSTAGLLCSDADGITLKDVCIRPAHGPAISFARSRGILIQGPSCGARGANSMHVEESGSGSITLDSDAGAWEPELGRGVPPDAVVKR